MKRLAILIKGYRNVGKTSTIRHYDMIHHKSGKTNCKRGIRYIRPFENFKNIIIQLYILPASPTESNCPLKKYIEDLDESPDFILMAEQLNGKEYQNTTDFLRENNYEIKEFDINKNGGSVWGKWEADKPDEKKLDERVNQINNYITDFIKLNIINA